MKLRIVFLILTIYVLFLLIRKKRENFSDLKLDDIFVAYSLDKANHFHGYSDYYDRTLSHLRNKKIKMIEIGIGTWEEGKSSMKNYWDDKKDEKKKNYKPGNSLRGWRKYFNKLDYILGVDVKKDCMFEEPNIKTLLLDSTKLGSGEIVKKKYGNNFDVVLDDGLHELEAQVKTFKNFWPLLKKKGIYLIEDIHKPELLKKELNKIVKTKIHIEKCNLKNAGNSYIIKLEK